MTLFWLILWALLARLADRELLLPGPIAVLRRLASLLVTASFWRTVGVTLGRILCGAALGTLLGVLAAVLTWRYQLLRSLLSPLLGIIKSTPVASFILLLLIWLGRDILPGVIVALMVLPVTWANVEAGLRGVDPLLLEMARVFRLPPLRSFLRVWLPSVLPSFLAACRSTLGLAWKAGVAAEVLTVPVRSIGKMLYESRLNLETTDLFAWTVVVILCSIAIEKLLTALLSRLPGQERGEEVRP